MLFSYICWKSFRMYLINSTQLPKILFVPCQEHFCKHFLSSKSALVFSAWQAGDRRRPLYYRGPLYNERLREPVILKKIFQAPLDLFVIMTFRTKKELTTEHKLNWYMPAFMILLMDMRSNEWCGETLSFVLTTRNRSLYVLDVLLPSVIMLKIDSLTLELLSNMNLKWNVPARVTPVSSWQPNFISSSATGARSKQMTETTGSVLTTPSAILPLV